MVQVVVQVVVQAVVQAVVQVLVQAVVPVAEVVLMSDVHHVIFLKALAAAKFQVVVDHSRD